MPTKFAQDRIERLVTRLVIAPFLPQQLLVKVSFACIFTIEYAGRVSCLAPTLNAHKDALGAKVELFVLHTVLIVNTQAPDHGNPFHYQNRAVSHRRLEASSRKDEIT